MKSRLSLANGIGWPKLPKFIIGSWSSNRMPSFVEAVHANWRCACEPLRRLQSHVFELRQWHCARGERDCSSRRACPSPHPISSAACCSVSSGVSSCSSVGSGGFKKWLRCRKLLHVAAVP
eukprot:scaffold11884_cov107-Phaeocystis_antarctica.AAC.4